MERGDVGTSLRSSACTVGWSCVEHRRVTVPSAALVPCGRTRCLGVRCARVPQRAQSMMGFR